MQVWCPACNKWYDTDLMISECPFCYTLNYYEDTDLKRGDSNELPISNDD